MKPFQSLFHSRLQLIAALLMLLLCNISAAGQQYPVQVTLTGPATLPGNVSGLYGNSGLRATLVLLDRYQPTLEVGIGFRVKGNGVTIERREDYTGTAQLTFSLPSTIGSDFFAPLLQGGILYTGVGRDAFENGGVLSTGRYEITLWAYDIDRPSVRLSNEARAYVWIQQSAPPALLQPLDKSVVYALPQVFMWSTAPSVGGLLPARYRYQLYELNDPMRSPAEEAASSIPLYEEEITIPSLAYGLGHPSLVRGRRYAWRVQCVAYDQEMREVQVFSNGGYTPFRSFVYGVDAVAALEQTFKIEAESENPYTMHVQAAISEDAGAADFNGPDGFTLGYRTAGTSDWQEIECNDVELTISNLTPATEYELRGRARYGAEQGAWGPMVTVSTQPRPEVECGPSGSYSPDATTHLSTLAVGDIVTANRIPFKITSSKGSGNTFTGTAVCAIPFFGGRQLSYSFTNVSFNQKYELTAGTLKADTIGIQKYISEQVAKQQAAKESKASSEKEQLQQGAPDAVPVSGDIADASAITLRDSTAIIVKTTDGKDTTITFDGKPIMLKDSTGEVYSVSADGQVAQVGMYNGDASGTAGLAASMASKPSSLAGDVPLVEFSPSAQQRYGFDSPSGLGSRCWTEKYDTISVGGRTELVAAKMVAAGSADAVAITLKGEAATHPDSLTFCTESGMMYKATPGLQKGTMQIMLAGGMDGSTQELTAWLRRGDTAVAVGRLSIDSYKEETRRVVIVPVGDATFSAAKELAKELTDIYMQAGVRWDATVSDQVLPMPDNVGESIKVDKSLLSAYSAGMRRIRSAFKSTSTYKRLGDNGVYYIFLTTLPMQGEDSGAGFDGYMPYGKPFGFVHSTSSEAKSLAWAIAHELGHGAFQLQHIWLEQGYSQDTRNLMGYSNTTELFRWQWNHIHNPVPHSNLMADEEDLGTTIKDVYLKWIPIKKSGNYTFLSPAGLPFSVKDPTEVLVDAGKVDANEYDYENILLKRCSVSVYSFKINGVRYASKTGKVFSGFYKEDNNEPYEDKITNRKEKKISVWLFDRSKLSSDFPFKESVCNYSIDDILASHSGSLYNKAGYYAAGKIPCRWNDEICLKKGGWNFATYDEKDIEYLLKSSVLRVAICSNPMVLEGETIHFADIISNYQMPFDLPSVREFYEKLWNCENENYWLTFLPRKDQLSMAGVCGLIAGAAETAVGAADLIQIAFYSKERKEFIDGICQLFTMDGFRQFCTTIKGNFVDNIWDNPNECERAYYEGKLLFDVASSVYGAATVIKSIKSAGGMLAFLKQAAESWAAIPKFAFDNLGKNNIVKLHGLNYSFKKTIAEAYIYYSLNANIKIATITSEGLIVPKVAIYVNDSRHVLTLKDVNYKIGNVVKKGDLELCVSGDEHYFVEKIPGSNKWETLAGDALKEKLKALPDGEFYNDFAGASDDVVRMFNRNPELVDEWLRVFKLGASLPVRKLVADGVKIKNLRPGTNGKYIIIGRDMGSVKGVADKLKIHAGKDNVLALDDDYLNGMKFKLGDYDFKMPNGTVVSYKKGFEIKTEDGIVKYTLGGNDEWTVDMAWNDMVYNPAYRDIKPNGKIIEDIKQLENIPMYKLDKKFIEMARDKGYEVVNIDNPANKEGISLFFNMEQDVMGW